MLDVIACSLPSFDLLADFWLTFKELIIAFLVIGAGLYWDSLIRKRQVNHAHINRFHTIMKQLTDEASNYWARDGDDLESKVSSSKITALYHYLINQVWEVIRFEGDEKQCFIDSLSELNDYITNGDFQSSERKAEPGRIQVILTKSGQILVDIEKAIL